MLKKIIITIMILSVSASSIFALSIQGSVSGSGDSVAENNLMNGFDELINDVKENKVDKDVVCSMDAKKCPDGTYVSRVAPNCEFAKCIGKEKKDIPKKIMCTKEYNPVCGAVDTGVRCITTPCPSTENKTFSNTCVAKSFGANILYDGECKAVKPKLIKEGVENTEIIKNDKKDFQGNFIFKVNDGEVSLGGQGILHNGQTTTIDLVSNDKLEMKTSGNDDGGKMIFVSDGEVVKFNFEDGDKDIKVVGGKLNIGDKEVKVKAQVAKEKAKKASSADIAFETEIKTEDDGKVIYLVKTQKKAKFLGLFNFNLNSEVKVDVETGAVIEVDEP